MLFVLCTTRIAAPLVHKLCAHACRNNMFAKLRKVTQFCCIHCKNKYVTVIKVTATSFPHFYLKKSKGNHKTFVASMNKVKSSINSDMRHNNFVVYSQVVVPLVSHESMCVCRWLGFTLAL